MKRFLRPGGIVVRAMTVGFRSSGNRPRLRVLAIQCIWLVVLLFGAGPTATAMTIHGVPTYSDGDTVELQGQRVRLLGIDTPEYSQSCKDSSGQEYPCGITALRHLKSLVDGREIRCEGDAFDRYGRLLATCYAGDLDLNRELVLDGWAVAFVKYDKRYLPEENEAKAARRGMWQGEFTRPVDYRAERWAASAQEANVSSPPSEDCVIKGNINRKGERIYHTPWASRDYEQTQIDVTKGERWFCSESDAVAAGWRAPRR